MGLIGAIIGDIIGSQYEFHRPDNFDWKNCPLLTNDCEFTDDTVMSIATKVAIEKYDCDFEKAYKEFGRMYPNVEYGSMFAKWLTSEIEHYESFGNGSAMRVSYIGECVPNIKIAESEFMSIPQKQVATETYIKYVSKLAIDSAKCTHNTFSGIRAAVVTAMAIALAKLGFDKDEIFVISKTFYQTKSIYTGDENLAELRYRYKWCDFADHTVPIALRCFYESEDYESCMRNCFSLDCDMDTVCCIAGSIAEEYYGTTGLDNKAILQKYLTPHLYDCIKDLLE